MVLLGVGVSVRVDAQSNSSGSGANLNISDPAAAKIYSDDRKSERLDNACDRAKNTVKDAKKNIQDACRKSGMGDVNACLKNSLDCGQVEEADTYSSSNQLFSRLSQMSSDPNVQMLGGVLDSSQTDMSSDPRVKSACPKWSGKDYFTERDKVNKDLKSTKDDLTKINDDKAKIQDDFNKDIANLQEDLTKASKEYNKKKLDMSAKARQDAADIMKQQTQLKDELRKVGTQALTLRGQLIQSQQDQALRLIAMSDASGKRACMKAVSDARNAYQGLSANGTSLISEGNRRKQDLINIFNDCMSTFNQQRNALNLSKKQEQDQINKAITDNDQQLAEMQNALNAVQSQSDAAKADATTEAQQDTTDLQQLQSSISTKMLAAQQKMQTNLQTLDAKRANSTNELNRLNNSLLELGPVPKTRGDLSGEEASSDISGQVDIILSTWDDNSLITSDGKKCFDQKDPSLQKDQQPYRDYIKSSSKAIRG
ncbi:MAG TPA: hypothetical protein VN132_01330 [Bdellovibrio sp.]|nr:hypothetical protein [Bdellovibrio sp.]